MKENKEKFYSKMLENKELILKEINETIINNWNNIVNNASIILEKYKLMLSHVPLTDSKIS